MNPDVPLLRSGKSRAVVITFSVLLILACTVRSGVIVDRSFLPRLILLTSTVLVFSLILFKRMARQKFDAYEIIFLIFCGWIFLGALWAQVPSEVFVQGGLYTSVFVLFLIVRTVMNREFIRIFLILVMILLYLSFVLAFAEIFRLPFYDPYQVYSVSANNNLYAGLLLLCMAFLFMGYSNFNGFLKILMILAGIISMFFIIILQSRAVYLGTAVTVIFLFLLMVTRYRHLFIRKHLIPGLISTGILAAGVVVFYLSLDEVRQNYFRSKIPVWNYFHDFEGIREEQQKRLARQADLLHIGEFDYAEAYYENASLRLIFWKKSIPLIKHHPFTGTGAGNWRLIVPSVPHPPNPDHTWKNFTYSQPHNEWICFITELGIPGFIMALAVFLGPVIFILSGLFRKGNISFIKISAVAVLSGFYTYACFDFPFHRVEHMILLFVLPGILMEKKEAGEPSGSRRLLIAGLMILTMFVLMIYLFRIYGEFYTLRMFSAERKDEQKVIVEARKAENIFYKITPNGLPVAWFKGTALYRTGDRHGAVLILRRALSYTPFEVRLMNDYATALFSLGQDSEGKQQLQDAYAIDPYFEDVKYNLAAVFYLSGRRDSAWYYLSRCRETGKKMDMMKEMGMR